MLEAIHIDVALIAEDKARVAVEHDETLGHIGNCRVEAHVLRVQIGLPRSQFARALDDLMFQVAVDGVDLLDHQCHGSVGAPTVAVEFLIGTADEIAKAFQIDRSEFVGRLDELLRK